MPYLDQIPGQTQPYYKPYQDAGGKALGDLTDRYTNMLNNPEELYNKLGAGYKESPGYKLKLQQGLDASNNAMAMGGQLGTPQHQQLDSEVSQGIAGKDFQDYMDRVTGIYNKGLGGEEGVNKMGFDANTDYGKMIAQLLGTKAQYSFGGTAGQNQFNSQNMSNIMQLLPYLFS